MIHVRHVLITGMFTLVASFSNCSIFDSASTLISRAGLSVSDSTSALVKSISNSVSSLSGNAKEAAWKEYREDVSVAVALHLQASEPISTMETSIAGIAKEHGVVSWKSHRATYLAIGEGLKLAKAKQEEIKTLLLSLQSSHPEISNLIQEGAQF